MTFNPPLSPAEIDAAFPGRFAQLSALKSGGQGSVFRVTVGSGRTVPEGTELALKVYYADHVVERTDREIAALRRIQSDFLVKLVDTGHINLRGLPCVWLETEFIEGESLAPRIPVKALSVEETATIVHDIALAIQAIWAHHIVHRDIKPDNIMMRLNGRAVLIDLGVARHLAMTSLTTMGKTLGTEGYLSPEQAQTRRALTCKSDIFALGIVAQEGLLGRHPTGRRQALLMSGGPSTTGLVSGLPAGFTVEIDSMLALNAFTRPLPAAIAAAMRPFAGL